MKNLLEKILGANSKIRSIALLLLGSYIVLRFPAVLHGLPAEVQKKFCDVASEILGFGPLLALWFLKQANVTGNGTPDAPYEKPDPRDFMGGNRTLPPKLPILIAALACTIGLAGCSPWTNPPERQAAISALTKSATRIIGNIAVGQLKALVGAELSDTDYAHAAADAAWRSVDAGDIAELINAATGNKAPALAAAASNIAYDSLENGFSKEKTFAAIASAISAAAFAK